MSTATIVEKQRRSRIALAAISIALITFCTFIPSLSNDFTNWDDNVLVTRDNAIKDLSWNTIASAFTSYHLNHYHPLVILSFALEYHFVGLNPSAYHAINIVLHILNASLVFWFVFLLDGSLTTAAVAALLFGIHPLHVEPVAWISARKDTLSTFFFLVALVSYLLYRHREEVRALYLLTLISFLLSLLSKAIAVTLPFILILLDYTVENKLNKNRFRDKIPFFALSIAFGIVAALAQYSTGVRAQDPAFDIFRNPFLACYGIVFYLNKFLVPINLSAFYPYPEAIGGHFPMLYWISPIIMVVLFAYVWYFNRHRPWIRLGSLFFLLTVLPVLQLIPVGRAIAADRFVYIPSIGIFYLVGKAWNWAWSKLARIPSVSIAFLCISAILVAVLSYTSWERNKVWKNSVTLWSDVISQFPTLAEAHNNRGAALAELGDVTKARLDFTTAIGLDPKNEEYYFNRATTYTDKAQADSAISDYSEALRWNPADEFAYIGRGVWFYRSGHYRESISDLTQALMFHPLSPEPRGYRALAYFKAKENEKALEDVQFLKQMGIRIGTNCVEDLTKLFSVQEN